MYLRYNALELVVSVRAMRVSVKAMSVSVRARLSNNFKDW